MYNRNEHAKIKQEFWTSFGRYMMPVQSAGIEKVNWVNYKTGIKGIFFKMDVGISEAVIAIEFSGDDFGRKTNYEKFLNDRSLFETVVPGNWEWIAQYQCVNGKWISIIKSTLTGVNITDKKDWPDIISFLKSRIIGVDNYWTGVKDYY